MKFNKLRLLGFKSFVEPTEFAIEPGLTGVVGPNGCGKSNLVEALRWVMGENSYKNMRASSMDDVIFSGSGARPARNTAEVGLFLDNDDRTAPAAYNDADELQISRRIERESGSVYRINGKDVRAKDVQLLFADASTGARSPSMIGQGRIGELISAKPQARRALLEEAAGISGLHSRRHEAELRLRAAETNLERLEDVISQLESQLDSLKRQARQANRYRNISGDIRRAEATLFHLRWIAAKQSHSETESALSIATALVGERSISQTQAAKAQAIIAHRLPELRDAEAKAAAALQRVTIARNQMDEEAKRLSDRRSELDRRIGQLSADITREEQIVSETQELRDRLKSELETLNNEIENSGTRDTQAKAEFETASEKLAQNEKMLADLTAENAEAIAAKNQLEQAISENTARLNRLNEQIRDVEQEHSEVSQEIAKVAGTEQKLAEVEAAELALTKAEAVAAEADTALEKAREAEQAGRAPLSEAQAELNRIETEARTLSKILNAITQELFPAVVEQIKVERGFEAALGAALGEDLDVPVDASAAVFWKDNAAQSPDAALPQGAKPLLEVVKAPKELHRRLSQIGIVSKAAGSQLQSGLKAGQRLVSVEGDLWRWDGYTAGADAPTAAAQRLEQKNRLSELDSAAIEVTRKVRALEAEFENSKSGSKDAADTERAARDTVRERQQELTAARNAMSEAERAVSALANRRSALDEAKTRIASNIEEAQFALEAAKKSQKEQVDLTALEEKLNAQRSTVAQDRASVAEARAIAEGLSREAQARINRVEAIASEQNNWTARAQNAQSQIDTLKARRKEAEAEVAALNDAPDALEARQRELLSQIAEAEEVRKLAADALAVAEKDQADADRAATTMITALSEARESSARAEERLNAAVERKQEIESRIRDELECEPHEALALTELKEDAALPEAQAMETRLEKLKAERERLGAVNLRAEAEQTEILEQRDTLVSERDDLIEAIRKLRSGIQSLNKEGRVRLLEAFDKVNDQFQRLFTHLFGGGTAELQLVESDDPLEAGLEILARPPGKKPQTMTLLSGGEQALTAMALIFAVFLTNPAPICVLDEVDAPLDDQNVERFCNLLDEMSGTTDTRFMVITHNPITMARMNRLFGVTMAERGVSQLVSVDLQAAEKLVEAV